MKKNYLCGILFALYISTPVLATPLLTLDDLLDDGSLTVGDKVFDSWELIDNSYGFDLSQIDVTGDNTDPLNPGINYDTSNALSLSTDGSQGQSASLSFSFDVHTISGLSLIKDNSLQITGSSFVGEGYISIGEAVIGIDGPNTQKFVWADSDGSSSVFDSLVFDPVNSLSISTYIYMAVPYC